jgi:hypothetical protein
MASHSSPKYVHLSYIVGYHGEVTGLGLRGGLSIRAIAAALNAEGVPAKRGGQWHPTTVARVLGRKP